MQTESAYILKNLNNFIFTQKGYGDTVLNLSILSNKLGISKRRTSTVIKSNYNKSFTEFVNDLRLEEVLIAFKNNNHNKHTIVAVAIEAGFPSKSTFYRYFKKKMKVPPSEYLAQ